VGALPGTKRRKGCVAVTWIRLNEPNRSASSCGKAEHLVDETNFACQSRPGQDAVTTTDHAHGFEAFEGGGGWFYPLEAACRPDHALERNGHGKGRDDTRATGVEVPDRPSLIR
jgi:hypothetical protein